MISSKRRTVRLSKMILSSSVRDGGGVSIKVGVVVSAVVAAIVIVGVGVVGFWGAALFSVVFVLPTAGVFSSSTSFGGSFGLSGVAGLFLLPWSHKGLNKRRCYGW